MALRYYALLPQFLEHSVKTVGSENEFDSFQAMHLGGTSDNELSNSENINTTISISPENSILRHEYIEIRDTIACSFVAGSDGKLCPEQSSILLHTKEALVVEHAQKIVEILAKDLRTNLISCDVQDLEDIANGFHHQDMGLNHVAERRSVKNKDHFANLARTSYQGILEGGDIADRRSDIGTATATCKTEFEPMSSTRRRNPKATEAIDSNEEYHMAKFYFGTPKPTDSKASQEAHIRNTAALNALINIDLCSIGTRHTSPSSQTQVDDRSPWIILIRDTLSILKLPKGFRIISRLRDALAERRRSGTLIFGIFLYMGADPDDSELEPCIQRDVVLKKTGASDYLKLPMPVEPRDREKLKRQGSLEANVRELKRGLKRNYSHLVDEEIIGKWASWNWAGMSRAKSFLSHQEIASSELRRIIKSIAARAWRDQKSKINPEDVMDVLDERATRRTRQKRDEEDDPIIHMEELDEAEKELSRYVMKPGQSHISYDDVIVDKNIKETVQQIIILSKLKVSSGPASVLDQFKTPGILFFGPPGTGKTHLCRAIANDSGHTFIALSAAELNSGHVGKTEKMIRAAFSLARKLYPSIVFLDEADALFYKRTEADKSWERSALTQYLQEMDGLASSCSDNNAPLVIIATNRPADLDEAFLRRLPHKVYFDLPSHWERKQILTSILMKDNIESEIDLEELARLTDGFSGSDLRALCSQAALAWAVELGPVMKDALEGVKIELKMKHFDLALSRTGPSTSQEVLDTLKSFSKRFQRGLRM